MGTPRNGVATAEASGVRYTPARDYQGRESFTYTVADPEGLTARATVSVRVRPANRPPVAEEHGLQLVRWRPCQYEDSHKLLSNSYLLLVLAA